jgi:hypothetical protein
MVTFTVRPTLPQYDFRRTHSTPPLLTDIGPFYFRKIDYQVSIRINTPEPFQPEAFDHQRLQELSRFRLQVFPLPSPPNRVYPRVYFDISSNVPTRAARSSFASTCAAVTRDFLLNPSLTTL